MNPKPIKPKDIDPFFGLKYIAYCRTGLPVNEEDVDEEAMLQFAKWQVCKIRNRLWNDPIWAEYTTEEIMIEYFSIKFDENEELRQKFEASLVSVKQSELDWFERQEKKLAAEKQGKIKEGETVEKPKESPVVEFTPTPPEEFEDKF